MPAAGGEEVVPQPLTAESVSELQPQNPQYYQVGGSAGNEANGSLTPVPQAAPEYSYGENSEEAGSDRLLGLFAPSDAAFGNFISPLTNPLFFEDPRTLTELRPIFANHWFPHNNPVFQGGQAQYFAVQARAALTERLSIIATKDGYMWLDPKNAAVPDTNGWADVAAGLKYNLVRNPETQTLLSVGVTYEFDVGSHKVFQGKGDGEVHAFLTGGQELAPGMHWLSATGFRLPTDTQDRSQMWYFSNHLDVEVVENLFALVELNWFHWLQSGNRTPVNFEGLDLINLGATDVAGNDIVTVGFGGKMKILEKSELGVGYEIPVTQRKDIIQSRIYADLILRY